MAAPRLSASIPIAPLPLNTSRNRHPGISFESILNKVSFILSVVGLVSIESIVTSFRLLALPAITLIFFSYLYVLYIINFSCQTFLYHAFCQITRKASNLHTIFPLFCLSRIFRCQTDLHRISCPWLLNRTL